MTQTRQAWRAFSAGDCIFEIESLGESPKCNFVCETLAVSVTLILIPETQDLIMWHQHLFSSLWTIQLLNKLKNSCVIRKSSKGVTKECYRSSIIDDDWISTFSCLSRLHVGSCGWWLLLERENIGADRSTLINHGRRDRSDWKLHPLLAVSRAVEWMTINLLSHSWRQYTMFTIWNQVR